MPSLSLSKSCASGWPSPSVSFITSGVPPLSGSTTSASPSISASGGTWPIPMMPLLSGSDPPPSITSVMPSLSLSRSILSGIPSPSVSPGPSTTSGIPSLSSSRSVSSAIPSPSVSMDSRQSRSGVPPSKLGNDEGVLPLVGFTAASLVS